MHGSEVLGNVIVSGDTEKENVSCSRSQWLFRPLGPEDEKDHTFYRDLYPRIICDIEVRHLST